MKYRLGGWIKRRKGLILVFLILLVIFIIAYSQNSPNSNTPSGGSPSPTVPYNVASSVVNVFCDNKEGGSGTIWLTDGTILTNNHVIAGSKGCLVSLPDPNTGAPAEIYNAEPYIVPKLSKQYDMAVLVVTSAYKDSDGKVWGTYPKTFSAFVFPSSCKNNSPKLGDAVRIYGYPVTSGGYNLTITDGIISSFSDDGDILTSANIDNGNSGGLAVDQNDCMVGIPSAVLTGNYQNLGVIIPVNIISEFLNKASPAK